WRIEANGKLLPVNLTFGGVLRLERRSGEGVLALTTTGVWKVHAETMQQLGDASSQASGAQRISRRDCSGRVWINVAGTLRRDDGVRVALGNTINDFLTDRGGDLWVATAHEGIVRVRAAAVTTIGRAQGLPADVVYPIVRAGDGAMWIGMQHG